MKMISATQEAKLAYLAGLCAGVHNNKSQISKEELRELEKHAATAAECVFDEGTFRGPLVVFEALSYFDSLFSNTG